MANTFTFRVLVPCCALILTAIEFVEFLLSHTFVICPQTAVIHTDLVWFSRVALIKGVALGNRLPRVTISNASVLSSLLLANISFVPRVVACFILRFPECTTNLTILVRFVTVANH